MGTIRRLVPLRFVASDDAYTATQFETFEHGFLIETKVAARVASRLGEKDNNRVIVGVVVYGFKSRMLHYGEEIQEPSKHEWDSDWEDGFWDKGKTLYSRDIAGLRFEASFLGAGRKIKVPAVTRTHVTQHGFGRGSWKTSRVRRVKGFDGKPLERPYAYHPKYLCITVAPIPSK